MDNKINELIEKKAFEELTMSEKSLVLNLITELVYNERRKSLLQIKDALNSEAKQLKANENIRLVALQALQEKQETAKTPIIPLLFSYKIPVWIAIAAMLLISFLLSSLLNTEVNKQESNQQLALQDTVYIDRIVNDTVEIIKHSNPVIKTVYVKENASDLANQPTKVIIKEEELKNLNIRELDPVIAMRNHSAKIDFSTQASGKSLSNDPLAKSILNVK